MYIYDHRFENIRWKIQQLFHKTFQCSCLTRFLEKIAARGNNEFPVTSSIECLSFFCAKSYLRILEYCSQFETPCIFKLLYIEK